MEVVKGSGQLAGTTVADELVYILPYQTIEEKTTFYNFVKLLNILTN
jgi:hypothetical protein